MGRVRIAQHGKNILDQGVANKERTEVKVPEKITIGNREDRPEVP